MVKIFSVSLLMYMHTLDDPRAARQLRYLHTQESLTELLLKAGYVDVEVIKAYADVTLGKTEDDSGSKKMSFFHFSARKP